MAGVKWRELLDPQTGEPFKNYYRYRNWKAQVEGFKSYNEKRKLRKQGVYTSPSNARPRRPSPVKLDQPPAPQTQLPKAAEQLAKLRQTNLRSAHAATQEAIQQWASGGWVHNVSPASKAVTPDQYAELYKDLDAVFGDGDRPGDYTYEVWKAGFESVGAKLDELSPLDRDYLVTETDHYKNRLGTGLNNMRQRAAAWDRGAKRIQTQEQAEKYLKRNPTVSAETYSNGTKIDMRFMEEQIYSQIHGALYQRARLRGMDRRGGQLVRVHDGKGCGWANHKDPVQADGLILPIEEAMAQPQAHPFCQRGFELYKPEDSDKIDHDHARENVKRIRESESKRLEKAALAGGATAMLVAGVLGVATTQLQLQIGDAVLNGTIGDILANSIGPMVRRAAENLIALQQRIISVMQMSPANRRIAARVTEAAQQMRTELPDLNYTQEQAEQVLMEAVHNESIAWQQTGDSNVIGIASRRVLNMPEVEIPLPKVVGDNYSDFENVYRIKYYNKIPSGEDAVTYTANLMESQNIFVQSFLDSMRPVAGRYGRFSLPRINVIEGNVEAGKRVTHRYARFSLNPNDFIHSHLSIKPLRDGTLRTVKNIRINPNGLVRFGFVKDEKGVITPNMSLVPRGPLRIYSRINRSAAMKVERGTGNLIHNPEKGRFNSITTQVNLLTPWSRWLDSVGFKFRINLASLGIYKPQDILAIRWPEFRAFLQTNNPRHFKMVSAAADMHVRALNMFTFEHTLRIDENGMWAWRAGINEIEKSVRTLLGIYKEEFVSARVEDRSYLEALYRAYGESLAHFRGMGLEYRERLEAAKTQLGGRWRDLTDRPEETISWQTAQWVFHMAQKEVEQRVSDLTDVLVSYRRRSLADQAVTPSGLRLSDAQRIYLLTESKADQRWALQNSNLLVAFMEADYKALAVKLGKEFTDVEARAQEVAGFIERLLTRHVRAVPEKVRTKILARLDQLKLAQEVEEAPATTEINWGQWFWMRRLETLTPAEQDIMEAGKVFKADDIGNPTLYVRASDSEAATTSVIEAMRADGTSKWDPQTETLVRFVIDGSTVVRDSRLAGKYRVVRIDDLAADEHLYNYDLFQHVLQPAQGPLSERLATVVRRSVPKADQVRIRMVYLERVDAATADNARRRLDALATSLNEMTPLRSEPGNLAMFRERAEMLHRTFPTIGEAAERYLAEGRSVARQLLKAAKGKVTLSNEADLEDLIADHIGQADEKGRIAKALLELLGHAPVTTGRLYKAIDVTDAELKHITVGERIVEMMGLWTDDAGVIERGTARSGRSQVILVAKRGRYVNLEPFSRSGNARAFNFLMSGEFKVSNVLTQIRDDGSVVTWVEIDYARGAIT